MCGIAGIWRLSGPDPSDAERIGRMSTILAHRGPNDFGYLLANTTQGKAAVGQGLAADFMPDLLLASRRLSILDLSPQGRQPIANETGDVFVVFNGAIHNYIELRRELEGLGHVFATHTDTEIIVHAYEQWGPDCANRFNGMWAYAIWDLPNQRLVCSRDRFGIKPFCIARYANGFYFASEAKSLIAAGVPAVPNPRFVQEFMSYSFFVPGDETAFADIGQLPAGHNLIVTPSGERLSRYWSYTDASEAYDYRHPEDCLTHLLDDAVRLRLRSDVPIAVLLSGGLDSSATTVLAANHQGDGQFEAYTSAFPGYEKDEQRHAVRVAESRGIPHHIILYDDRDVLADLEEVTWAQDAPPAIGQLLARWRLLKAVSGKARIVLEGQGADEIFGGYPGRYLKPYVQSEVAGLRPWNLYPHLLHLVAAHHARKRPWFGKAKRRPTRQQPFDVRSLLSRDYAADGRDLKRQPIGPVPQVSSALHEKLWRDHSHDWLPHILHFGDAISMAHSVESRMPFLDHRLVEFAFGLPFDQIIRGTATKYILRKSLSQILPAEIVQRKDKIGFETPTHDWIQSRLNSEIRPHLQSQRVRDLGLFDHAALDDCMRRAETKAGFAHLVFQCCGLASWARQYIDGEGFKNLTVDDIDPAPGASIASEPEKAAGRTQSAAGG